MHELYLAMGYFFNWQFWLGALLILFFFIWMIFGGRNDVQYVGLSPLKIGVDATKYIDPSTTHKTTTSNANAKQYCVAQVDNTPVIPKLEPQDSVCVVKTESKFPKSECEKALGPYRAYGGGKISKSENVCKEAIEEIYNKPFYCIRPDFLKNPETKRNLELDCYNDELKIAVEMNGIQHYKWPNFTGQTKEQFIEQIRRDQFKVEQCDQNGIYLITVPYNVPKNKVKDYIRHYLPENRA